MAASDDFAGAGKAIGLELWRIEKMVPIKQPEVRQKIKDFSSGSPLNIFFLSHIILALCTNQVNGKLHSGDSYILLSTSKSKS